MKSTDEAIGCCGLILSPEDMNCATAQASEGEVGYWVGHAHWGRGYIPEAVRALVRHAFEELSLAALWINFYDGNDRSRRVAEKCGFTYHHTEADKPSPLGDRRTEHLMRLTAEEWRQQAEEQEETSNRGPL